MLIRLEHNGRIVQETGSDAISGELVIGRSHACTWPVPKEDNVSSSRHAALFKKGKNVWLKDLGSTNGTFCNGKRIEKKKLAVGDKISLGNCVLCVEPDRGGDRKSLSEVLILTGKNRGQKKQLVPPVFTIGSDPTSSLVFLDMLVSRRHAEILIKEDGSCWIRDLGSKNGTSVNEMPLRDDKERLLKDGDRIACSHFELQFHDGAVKHSNKQTWLRIGILGVTLLMGLGVYWTYQHLKPSAEAFIKEARRLAVQEAFEDANLEVEKAATARHAASNQVAIEELRRLLGVWKATLTLWQSAQQSLEQGEWVSASRELGMLQSSKREAWEWNAKASDERENAARSKAALDALLQAESLLGREDFGFDELSASQAAVKSSLDRVKAGEAPPAYLTRLAEQLNLVYGRQTTLLNESQQMEQALNQLKEPMPPYEKIVRVLEQTGASKELALKRRATVLAEPVKALALSFNRLTETAQQVRRLEFKQALAINLDLPSVDACTLDPRVSQARQTLENIHLNLKVKTGQLMSLFGEVEKRAGREGDVLQHLEALQNVDVLTRVMACDSLNQALPKRSRKEPAGEYDRVLGVEEFYAYLSALPDPVDPASLADLPFTSVLGQARQLCQKIDLFMAFVQQPDNQWLMADQMGQQVSRLKGFLQRRDALVRVMVTKAEASSGREAVIAGGIAARLTTTSGSDVHIKNKKPEEWIADELKKLRGTLLRLNEEYSLATLTRQIEIRSEILKNGIPGDPVVRRMWAMKDAAAASPSPRP